MQDKYIGDIGDFAKFGLLRALGRGHRLGVAWYLFPDEAHNSDGRHIDYLKKPDQWRHLDSLLFDELRSIVETDQRTTHRIEQSGQLPDAVFSSVPLDFTEDKATARKKWFERVQSDLEGCSMIFADPDNGLCEDSDYKWADRRGWKRIPLSEILKLAEGRVAVVYHHNTRRPGGHDEEIAHWLGRLKACGADAIALRWGRISPRTFFIVHPTAEVKRSVDELVQTWSPHFHLMACAVPPIARMAMAPGKDRRLATSRTCPECSQPLRGNGWTGIDAHWKKNHEDIMPYEKAWPVLKKGGRPSESASGEGR
jgi:hypothetical protein